MYSEMLLTWLRAGHAEIYASRVVGFLSGVDINLRQRDFLGTLRREDPERLANDGVILHVLFPLIAENQNRRWYGRGRFLM